MAHLNLCSKSMIRMACDPRSESPCSVLRLLSKVMVATVLQGKVLYYCLLKKKMFVCLYIYIFFFLTNIYNFLHCLSSFKPGWKVEKRPPINMHGQINYRNGSRGEKIWISWDICATGKIIPNSNQVEWSNQQNTHC